MLGLYLHIPFCSAICNYCNFNRGLFDAAQKARYVEALLTEIRRARLKCCAGTETRAGLETGASTASVVAQDFSPARADTIYFGGGTPSLLEPDEVGRLIAACRDAFDVA